MYKHVFCHFDDFESSSPDRYVDMMKRQMHHLSRELYKPWVYSFYITNKEELFIYFYDCTKYFSNKVTVLLVDCNMSVLKHSGKPYLHSNIFNGADLITMEVIGSYENMKDYLKIFKENHSITSLEFFNRNEYNNGLSREEFLNFLHHPRGVFDNYNNIIKNCPSDLNITFSVVDGLNYDKYLKGLVDETFKLPIPKVVNYCSLEEGLNSKKHNGLSVEGHSMQEEEINYIMGYMLKGLNLVVMQTKLLFLMTGQNQMGEFLLGVKNNKEFLSVSKEKLIIGLSNTSIVSVDPLA